MTAESGARASNTLSGELRSRPLAVLLAGACDRRTSGTFTFRHGSRTDAATMRGGRIAVVRTSDPMGYLGGVLCELGAIDLPTLNSTLREVVTSGRLHGEILLQRGKITGESLAAGLVEQTFLRTCHLFTLPEETSWTFRTDVDDLSDARDQSRPPIDTWKAIWRGLRGQPVAPHVRRTLAKVEGAIRLRDAKVLDQFGLTADERAVGVRLCAHPTTLARIISTSSLPAERTELLVYLFALSRSVVRVESQPVGPAELGVEGVRERARSIDGEDPKTVLGVRAAGSVEAARAAYFRLARLWHPDRIPESLGEVRSECRHVFSKLGDAHRALTEAPARHLEGAAGLIIAPLPEHAGAAAPAITMRDVDAALAANDLEVADGLARTLSSAGGDGPAARAVIAWCGAGAGMSASPESLERAHAALEKVVTGDPDCVRALFYRAQISSRQGRVDAAMRDYRKVIRLDPRHEDARRELRSHEELHQPGAGNLREIPPGPDDPRATTSVRPGATRAPPPPTGDAESSEQSGVRWLRGRAVQR